MNTTVPTLSAAPISHSTDGVTPLLAVKNLRVAFDGHEVVHGLDFHIHAGEKLALVGESGSGKTVSALALLRLVQNAHISGQAVLQGQGDLLALPERALRAVRGREVAMIFQEPMTALNPLYTVGDQIAEVLQLKRALSRAQASAGAVELLASTGMPEPARRAGAYPHQLSGGQRQRAMIAMALASAPQLLLADEPTTALDASLRLQMLALLDQVQREHGMALLLITHDLNLVQRFADRVLVMAHGHLVEHGAVSDVFYPPQHAYTQRLLASHPVRDLTPGQPQGQPRLQAQALAVDYPVPLPGFQGWWRKGRFRAVQPLDLALRPGRTVGVIGESGSGKSTLALAVLDLLGAEVQTHGSVDVAGLGWAQARRNGQVRRLRQQVQVVFQDPFSSLSPRLTVEQIVGEGLRVHQPALTEGQRRERVLQALAEVGLPVTPEGAEQALLSRYPHEFSGGQRQRIALARALIVSPNVLVLDEPTSALDVTVQQQIIALLQGLQRARGLSYLLITHDVAVVRALAHEVLVLRHGQVLEQGECEAVLNHPQNDYTAQLVAAS